MPHPPEPDPGFWRRWLARWRKKHPLPPKKKPKPKPPPPEPDAPPQPERSWRLDNGPWVFVTSDPGSCRPGPWTRLDLLENHIAPGAPLWYCNQGKVPQAEGGNQSTATIDWIKNTPGGSIAPVTTLGIPVAPYLQLGITSCFVECYLQGDGELGLRKYWQAGQDGWLDVIPVVGVYGGVALSEYMEPRGVGISWPGLEALGTRWGLYTCDAMSDQDWTLLGRLCA